MKTILLIFAVLLSVGVAGQEVKKDTVNLAKLEHTYKLQLITGGVTFAGTIGLIAGFVRFKTLHIDYASKTGVTSNNYLKQSRICLVFAGICTGISVYSFAKGGKNRAKYIDLSATPESVTLNITF